MAFEDVLDQARNIAGGFFSGTSGAEIGRRRQVQDLLGGIQEASAQPGFDATTNPLVAQLQAIAPQTGARVQTNFAELNEQRQKAMFQDAYRVRQALDRDPAQALDIISRRVQAGGLLGADMAETEEIGDLIASGNIEAAKEELDEFIKFGVDQGFGDGQVDIVQSSKILPDGSTIQTMRSGSTRFVDPGGNVLTGAERAAAIKAASEFGVDEQGQRARRREQERQAQTLAKDAFTQLPRIKTAISNLDAVERAIEQGAKSGVIESALPSVRAASIELDNLRNQMGLDVIGGTTFGALSESELAFALDTALPPLDEPDLLGWVQRKRAAQQKVADALTEQAKFFSRGGTIGDLLEKQEREQKSKQTGPETEVIESGGSTVGRFQIEQVE